MSLLSSLDEMNVCVELLADDAWGSEGDKQVSWILEWIVSVNAICKDNQYPCPRCKLVTKHKNMINEDKWEIWTNEKWDCFDKWWFFFLLDPPYEKDQKVK